MTSPLEVAHHWWRYYRERPFLRLARIFAERIFRGGGDADAEGMDLSVGLVLTLLALPGGFVSVLTFVKYSTFLSWMRGAPQVDPLVVAMPDEYFFITLSMAVTGTVAVWRWDSLFPDRRDYVNLVPLPLSTSLIFFANLAAVLFLAVLVAFDVNAASSLLFPLGVGATQTSFLFFLRFALIHALIVGLASVFAFFAVLTLLGFFLVVLPPRVFQRVSPYVRVLAVMYLVTLLSTSFALPEFLRQLPGSPREWIRWIPSCWFLGLCQSLRGRAVGELTSLSRMALPALALVMGSASLLYVVGYQRYFLRIAEIAELPSIQRARKTMLFREWFDRWVLRTPFQKGCVHFVWRTLFRSEAHRLMLAGVLGLGTVLAAQFLAGAMQSASGRGPTASANALAVPFVLAFFIVVGLRVVFEVPADLRSNWTFRLALDAERHECQSLARKIMLTFILPWVGLICLPAYAYVNGWMISVLHALLLALWSLLLANSVLVRFRILPFTCPLPAFQQHSIVTLLGGALGFFFFAVLTPQIESRVFEDAAWLLVLVPLAVLFWYIPHRMNQNAVEVERKLVFEEAPAHAVEVLQLGD